MRLKFWPCNISREHDSHPKLQSTVVQVADYLWYMVPMTVTLDCCGCCATCNCKCCENTSCWDRSRISWRRRFLSGINRRKTCHKFTNQFRWTILTQTWRDLKRTFYGLAALNIVVRINSVDYCTTSQREGSWTINHRMLVIHCTGKISFMSLIKIIFSEVWWNAPIHLTIRLYGRFKAFVKNTAVI